MKVLKRIRWMIIPILLCAAIVVLMKTVLFLGYVPSSSMEPTITAKSWILGNRMYGELETGDVVIFMHSGKTLVKRIAGMTGDTIYINDHSHEVQINKAMDDATRILVVPDECLFLLGDNKMDSVDARYWVDPFIGHDCVVAKMIL